ncbi:hypothetical protein DERP_000772 [Dermatophagoides pteronyssinus]|uniref:Uncharacterized protein n=1 Tax=Dermatophagoides pteronyssinus TaxID=6956 RepID=A0ABQ8J134_DERPT|nr:hypothetical protein DERP_000772 [Dermatophagoides pteronyssinus]
MAKSKCLCQRSSTRSISSPYACSYLRNNSISQFCRSRDHIICFDAESVWNVINPCTIKDFIRVPPNFLAITMATLDPSDQP